MRPLSNVVGERYGRLLIVSDAVDGPPGRRHVNVKCDCGNTKLARLDGLRSGVIVSCGCKKSEHNLKHGHRRNGSVDPTYTSWDSMWQRCSNPKSPAYKYYGGRGISVDPRWSEFSEFKRDMGDRPSGRTLERLDNDIGYSKSNCVWALPSDQNLNKRSTVRVGGVSLTKLAREAGMPPSLVRQRVKNGWSVEKALRTPNQRKRT